MQGGSATIREPMTSSESWPDGTGCADSASEPSPAAAPEDASSCWTVLIVDDDQGVHDVTSLVLSGEPMLGKPLRFLHAYSAVQARALLLEYPDVALLLLDVVMESEHAGLDLVEFIRNELHNKNIRIVLRTGQPGLAQQKQVVMQYDINGYLEKAKLTSPQLFCAAHTAISTYRDLVALDATQRELRGALNQVSRSESRFRLLLNNSPIGLAEVELDGRFAGVNPALCAMLGFSEQELLAKTFQDITHPDDLALDLANIQQLLDNKHVSYRMDTRYIDKSGHTVHIQLDVTLLRDEAGKPAHFISQIQNINERVAAQEHLNTLAQRLSLAVQTANIGVWSWDLKSGQLTWDERMHAMYGVPQGASVSYKDWKTALLPEDVEQAEAVLARAVQNRSASENRFRIVHPELGVRYIEASEEVVLGPDNQVVAVVGVNRDVTKNRQMEDALLQRQAEIVKLSLTDALTGLANRRRLDEQFETEVNRVQRYGGTLSVVIADLDHFKRINDEFGHEIGDKVLKAFSRTVESHVRDTDLIARLGGEEFVILMPQSGCNAAETVAERIRLSLAQTLIAPMRRAITVSFGIAEIHGGESAACLLRRADQALYKAKATGRNRTVIAGDSVLPRPPGKLSLAKK